MDELFPAIPEDFGAVSDEDLQGFADETRDVLREIGADPASYVTADFSGTDLVAAMRAANEALAAARVEIKARATAAAEAEAAATPELSDEEFAAEVAALAAVAEPEAEPEPEPAEPEAVEAEPEAVVAAATPITNPPLPAPAASRRARERTEAEQRVSLTAAASMDGFDKGEAFPSMEEIAKVMQARRRNFGLIPAGTSGEKIPIVHADWSHLYPAERTLSDDAFRNEALIADATNAGVIRREMDRRRQGALTASGGLCAPVTPYYQLQMISTADRPVRAALPSFNADRGGIRFARPASLGVITTGVGIKTAAEDEAGGTSATKTCQVVECPDWEESDVQMIFHCLQFGNLGARTFPERVTQWNNLTLAAHARLAESALLTGLDTASTQVVAGDLGLGASASLFSQILTAANGMRNRHRTTSNMVLRLMLPFWAVDLIVSDVIRTQFQRFDTDAAKVTALLRSFDVEPSFYIDGADGRGQVYGAQGAGALLPFPEDVVWYLYPEGSFLYVDGGTLELGLVRDSVLNQTNDFQIFGETFENIAFVGVESLAVASTLCDSGTVSLPDSVTCPVDYAVAT